MDRKGNRKAVKKEYRISARIKKKNSWKKRKYEEKQRVMEDVLWNV